MKKALLATVAAFFMFGVSLASAQVVDVVTISANSAPWLVSENPTMVYGITSWLKGATPTVVSVAGDSSVSLAYQSGTFSNLQNETGGPTSYTGVTPNGVIDMIDEIEGNEYEASGNSPTGRTTGGLFESGYYLPSYYIETTTGPDIWWGALIASFADSSGKVIGTPFAPGENDLDVVVPTGATELLLGVNTYMMGTSWPNSGSWTYDVTQNVGGVDGGVPEAPTYLMASLGFLAMAAFGARRARA